MHVVLQSKCDLIFTAINRNHNHKRILKRKRVAFKNIDINNIYKLPARKQDISLKELTFAYFILQPRLTFLSHLLQIYECMHRLKCNIV